MKADDVLALIDAYVLVVRPLLVGNGWRAARFSHLELKTESIVTFNATACEANTIALAVRGAARRCEKLGVQSRRQGTWRLVGR